MLRFVGVIFYVLAAYGALITVTSFEEESMVTVVLLSITLSSAFFGAMCMAAADIVDALRRILGNMRGLNNDGEALDSLVRILNNVRAIKAGPPTDQRSPHPPRRAEIDETRQGTHVQE